MVQLLQNTLRLAAPISQNVPAQVLPRAASPATRPLSDSGSIWLGESTPDMVCAIQQIAHRLNACGLTTSALVYQSLAL